MPATSALIGFALIAFGLVLTPGPNMILISRSITQGSAAGIVSLGGVALSTRPSWMRVQRYLMGTVLAGLAVRMAFEARRT